MTKISFTVEAGQDLDEIYEYIAKDNIDAAEKHRNGLQKAWRAIADHPRVGSKRTELKPDLRSITEGNYVIFYRILSDGIQIVRILHGSRDFKNLFDSTDAGQ